MHAVRTHYNYKLVTLYIIRVLNYLCTAIKIGKPAEKLQENELTKPRAWKDVGFTSIVERIPREKES